MTPAATVLPPSLTANLYPTTIGSGKCSLRPTVKLSPGIAISTFSGKVTSTAQSAVLIKAYGL